jgi:hypothetical protein
LAGSSIGGWAASAAKHPKSHKKATLRRGFFIASKNLDATSTSEDPEGGAQGCAPFFDRAMDGESKNPDSNETLGLLRRESVFLWFVSFDAYQKK